MTEKQNFKEVGRRWIASTNKRKEKIENHKEKLNKTLAKTLIIGAISGAACSSPKERYQSWETESKIESVTKQQKILIEAYKQYFDEYERLWNVLVELHSSGDIAGYQATFEQREDIAEDIKDIEQEIDELSKQKRDLNIDLTEGKQQNAADDQYLPYPTQLKRRTFLEKE